MRKVNKTLVLILALFLIPDAGNAMAQIIAIGPPSFQSNDFPSLETTILDRLALYGSDDPADLGTLAHLTVLESIAMLADIQYDMPNTILGARLESQIRQLWDSAALIRQYARSGSLDRIGDRQFGCGAESGRRSPARHHETDRGLRHPDAGHRV
jgi:hypothetical protein